MWECSHLGGHRFAANLVCLPDGLWFGRLSPEDALAAAADYESGRIDLSHLRGNSSLAPAAQAADYFVRRQADLLGIDDLILESLEADGAEAAATLRNGDTRFRVRVRSTDATRRGPSRAARTSWSARSSGRSSLSRASRPSDQSASTRLAIRTKGGALTKETAFYGKLAAVTDQWMDLFGYWAPTVVTDTLEEYRACREAAALMDFSMLRKVSLDGPGALALVNGIVTRDVSKLSQGRIGYGALCDESGKMVDDCTTMMRSPDSVRFCGSERP